MAIRYLYLSLVGTSILRNIALTLKEKWGERYTDIESWHAMKLCDKRNIYPDGLLCMIDLINGELYNDMVEAARRLGERASAEIMSLIGAISAKYHSKNEVKVLLYPTASCTSFLSAKLNRELLVETGFAKVEVSVLEKLGRWETFEEGLVELLDRLVRDIGDAKKAGLRVFVNATPGFKAESSFLVLASLLAGADGIVYFHETFQEPIFIPAVPIRVDEGFVAQIKVIAGSEGRIPREVWGYLDMELRQMLEERGIVKCEKDYCEVRQWIRLLVEKTH